MVGVGIAPSIPPEVGYSEELKEVQRSNGVYVPSAQADFAIRAAGQQFPGLVVSYTNLATGAAEIPAERPMHYTFVSKCPDSAASEQMKIVIDDYNFSVRHGVIGNINIGADLASLCSNDAEAYAAQRELNEAMWLAGIATARALNTLKGPSESLTPNDEDRRTISHFFELPMGISSVRFITSWWRPTSYQIIETCVARIATGFKDKKYRQWAALRATDCPIVEYRPDNVDILMTASEVQ